MEGGFRRRCLPTVSPPLVELHPAGSCAGPRFQRFLVPSDRSGRENTTRAAEMEDLGLQLLVIRAILPGGSASASTLLSAPQRRVCLDPSHSRRSFMRSCLSARRHFCVSGVHFRVVARRWLGMKGASRGGGLRLAPAGLASNQRR